MYIKTQRLEITLSEDDTGAFESMLYSAKRGLEESIKIHYNSKHHDHYGRGVSHAKGLFIEQKGTEIAILSSLFARFGNNNIKQDLLDFLETDYKKQHGE
jgi:hypothetical protein